MTDKRRAAQLNHPKPGQQSRKRDIVKHISEGVTTAAEIARRCDYSYSYVRRMLDELKEEGIVSVRNAAYYVIDL